MSDWTDTIDALIDYLRYQQENGVRQLTVDTAALRELDVPPRAAAPATASGDPTVASFDPMRPVIAATNHEQRAEALAHIAAQTAECRRCGLCAGRSHAVPGQGNPDSPDIMFIGDTPSAGDDAQGVAFTDTHGDLLSRMIAAMGYSREEVFLTNVCKCHPPGNRRPTREEMRTCLPYLTAQIEAIKPKVIVALGADAAAGLTNAQAGVAKLRGQWTRLGDIPLIATYHPKNKLMALPPAKREAWHDLKLVLAKLGRPVPPSNKSSEKK